MFKLHKFFDFINEGYEHNPDFSSRIIQQVEGILSGINIETGILYDPKNALNSKNTLFLKVVTDEKNRSKIGSFLLDEFKSLDLEMLDIPNAQKFGVRFKDKNENINVLILVKPNGKRSVEVDPNEAMVACLLAMPNFDLPQNDNEMDKLISECLKYKKKITNANSDVFNFFEKNYVNLIQAASAAHAIKNKIGNKTPDKIYLTGGTYPKEIEFLKINHLNMKDYNSSDLILKVEDKYIGISLKKAANSKAIPTLLNKAVSGVIDPKSSLSNVIVDATNEFFNCVVNKKLKTKCKNTDWKKHIHSISNEEVNSEIKGNISHFKTIHDAFIDMDDEAIQKILSLIFKLDLKKLLDFDFDFYLVTGIGDYGPKKGVVIEEGHISELNTVVDLLEKLTEENKIEIRPSNNKKQAFEEDAKAAKLFFDIVSGTTHIIHLEIRYKGSFTSQPQLFAFLSEEFKKLVHNVK